MTRPCRCDRFDRGRPYDPARDCRLCWLYAADVRYRRLWGGDPADLEPPSPPRGPCRFEGPVVSWCPKGGEDLHERRCLHDDGPDGCRRAHECRRCPLYRPPSPADVRHLLYHVYPVGGNGAWQWNVDQLLPRLPLFNGRLIVAVVTDPPAGRKADPRGKYAPDRGRFLQPCDPIGAVKGRFGGYADRVEWIEMENDSHLREVLTHGPLLERLAGCGPGEAALYAHAKGTTRYPNHVARRWTEAMYEIYLDYWPAVEGELERFPITGAFKKLGPAWSATQTHSDWHYSGSWFWFRCPDVFARDWRRIDRFWSGIESWPAQQFPAREAGCIFHTARVPQMNLYRPQYWDDVVDPELARFREANAARRTVT